MEISLFPPSPQSLMVSKPLMTSLVVEHDLGLGSRTVLEYVWSPPAPVHGISTGAASEWSSASGTAGPACRRRRPPISLLTPEPPVNVSLPLPPDHFQFLGQSSGSTIDINERTEGHAAGVVFEASISSMLCELRCHCTIGACRNTDHRPRIARNVDRFNIGIRHQRCSRLSASSPIRTSEF